MINKFIGMGIVSIGALLGGCAASPVLSFLSYLKTGVDVVSYATTSKGTTDHAISAYMDKDCALHRVVIDDKVCKLTQKQVLEQVAKDHRNDGLVAD